jgi:hypothetical protein
MVIQTLQLCFYIKHADLSICIGLLQSDAESNLNKILNLPTEFLF